MFSVEGGAEGFFPVKSGLERKNVPKNFPSGGNMAGFCHGQTLNEDR